MAPETMECFGHQPSLLLSVTHLTLEPEGIFYQNGGLLLPWGACPQADRRRELTLQGPAVEGTRPAECGLHSPILGPAPTGPSLLELRDKCFHFSPMGIPIKEIKLIDNILIFLHILTLSKLQHSAFPSIRLSLYHFS